MKKIFYIFLPIFFYFSFHAPQGHRLNFKC